MPDRVSERVKELSAQIEEVRDELRRAVLAEGGLSASESTYSISDRLDRLIVEFIRLRDQISE